MSDMLRERVIAALEQVNDPETGLSMPAMGLIYDVSVHGGLVSVTMTTTTRGCPLTSFLSQGVKDTLLAVSGVEEAEVRLTWDPPWSVERMRQA